MMAWFWIGIAAGVALTIPLAAWAARRATRRTRRLEQRARAAERLAELGTMTGGLAHEIKNPLSTVSLNLQLLREDLEHLARDAPAAADRLARIARRFDTVSRETTRLKQILEDFLRFAGRMNLQLAPVNVNELLDELCDFFTPQATQAGVRLRTQLAADPAVVQADEGLLKQALLNLMINAVQAMTGAHEGDCPTGGNRELILRTQRAAAPGNPSRGALRIHVTDTGPGIAPEVADKIFTPYFSTKKGGTGLGLPTTRRIIEEHGGTIALHSEPGRGSDFVITLPSSGSL